MSCLRFRWVTPSLLLFLASAAAAMTATLPARAQTVVRYQQEGSRSLIFENNPERLSLNYTDPVTGVNYWDLADSGLGQKSLLRHYLAPGSYRNFFEHLNDSAGTIHYGIQLYNPNSTAITIVIRGKGFTTGRFGEAARPVLGGQPFVDLLTTRTAITVTLAAYGSTWVFRSDANYGNSRPILQGDFFSGVVDFDVSGGNFYCTNLAYQNFNSLTSWSYMGFITRNGDTPGDAPESRLYKGLMGGAVAVTLPFTVGNSTPVGDLAVAYPPYNNDGSGQYFAAAANTPSNAWYTHDLPWREDPAVVNPPNPSRVVANDMFNIGTPGFGTIYALAPTPVPNSPYLYANLGNWGVQYHALVRITNQSTRARSFALKLNTYSGGGGPIAYRDAGGVWRQTILGGAPFTYFTFSVPANTTRSYDAYFILGGPAAGRLRQSVTLTN
ncbi:MAG: hypothetical protein H7Z41_12760 [Cytophagales bacterium]|nr:hypothetical protein [Armatimonadota bacterium]